MFVHLERKKMYKLKQDDDCHWYLIPIELEEKFILLNVDKNWEEFGEMFDQFRINFSQLIIKDYILER